MTEPARSPDEILADIDALDTSFVEDQTLTARGIMWEVIEDVRSSYRLAMDQAHIPLFDSQRREIERAVEDYLANNYGDD